jgi:hypothetical protein
VVLFAGGIENKSFMKKNTSEVLPVGRSDRENRESIGFFADCYIGSSPLGFREKALAVYLRGVFPCKVLKINDGVALSEYEHICPGAAIRILEQGEREQLARIEREREELAQTRLIIQSEADAHG